VLPLALGAANSATYYLWRVLPDGTKSNPNNLAFVDASHLEAYSDNPWNSLGLGNFLRTLARNGYLPLRLYDEPFGMDWVWGERLERAGVLVSIGPAERFSAHQRQALGKMLGAGGTLICMCGAERAGPTNDLLAEYGLKVPPSPLPASPPVAEPEPMGRVLAPFLVQGEQIHYFQTYAAWPVEATGHHSQTLATGRQGEPVVMSQPAPKANGPGQVVVIGDTFVAVNENVLSTSEQAPANEDFWRWLIGQVTPHEEWIPPTENAQTGSAPEAAEAENGGSSPGLRLPEPGSDPELPEPGLEPELPGSGLEPSLPGLPGGPNLPGLPGKLEEPDLPNPQDGLELPEPGMPPDLPEPGMTPELRGREMPLDLPEPGLPDPQDGLELPRPDKPDKEVLP